MSNYANVGKNLPKSTISVPMPPVKAPKPTADQTIATVMQVGVIGLKPTTDEGFRIAEEATVAIAALKKENYSLGGFFLPNVAHDASYESVTYSIFNPANMSSCVLVRTIKYKYDREDEVVHGPLMPVAKAQAIIDILNS